jgi:hypothetical protein
MGENSLVRGKQNMQQPLKILLLVKQKPLFTVIQHILSDADKLAVKRMRSWASLKALLLADAQAFDIVLLDLQESEQWEAYSLLRSVWPQTKIVLLSFDKGLMAHRAPAFDAVIAKCDLVNRLPAFIKRMEKQQPAGSGRQNDQAELNRPRAAMGVTENAFRARSYH